MISKMSKPKFSTCGKEWTMHSPTQSMYEVLSDMLNTELFLLLIEKTNLSPLLQEDEEYTVFIPVDNFFVKNHKELLPLLDQMWCSQQFVMNHFVKGRHLMSGEKPDKYSLQTFQGSDIMIENKNGLLKLNEYATFLDMNLECRNGIVHIVDRFLVPSPDIFSLPPERFLKFVEPPSDNDPTPS